MAESQRLRASSALSWGNGDLGPPNPERVFEQVIDSPRFAAVACELFQSSEISFPRFPRALPWAVIRERLQRSGCSLAESSIGIVSEPRAVRGPRASISREVQDAIGSRGTFRNLAGLLDPVATAPGSDTKTYGNPQGLKVCSLPYLTLSAAARAEGSQVQATGGRA